MIKKVETTINTQPQTELEKAIVRLFDGVTTKLNEIIDAVNTIQKEREAERFEIQEWIGILEDVRKSVNKHGKLIDTLVEENNIHEEQIDELQMKVEPEKCETRPENVQPDAESRPENVQDKFAEQRKWIGKLCRFWDDDAFITSNDWAFGILTSIDKGMQFQYCCNENCNFKHCEPVKPGDDIIYKGE